MRYSEGGSERDRPCHSERDSRGRQRRRSEDDSDRNPQSDLRGCSEDDSRGYSPGFPDVRELWRLAVPS